MSSLCLQPPSPCVETAAIMVQCLWWVTTVWRVEHVVRCMPGGGRDQTRKGSSNRYYLGFNWQITRTINKNVMNFKRLTDHPRTFTSSLVNEDSNKSHHVLVIKEPCLSCHDLVIVIKSSWKKVVSTKWFCHHWPKQHCLAVPLQMLFNMRVEMEKVPVLWKTSCLLSTN